MVLLGAFKVILLLTYCLGELGTITVTTLPIQYLLCGCTETERLTMQLLSGSGEKYVMKACSQSCVINLLSIISVDDIR